MRVRKQNEGAGGSTGYVGTSTTEHGISGTGWVATFVTEPGLLFLPGDRARAQPTDQGATLAYMDGVVAYYTELVPGVSWLLDIAVDHAVKDLAHPGSYTSWNLLNMSAVVAGDMQFGHQQADFLRDSPDAVAQVVLTRLRLWTGEWFLDTTAGTPYAGAVLGVGTRRQIEPALRSRILGTPGVSGIDSLSMVIDPDGRHASLSAIITTQFGQAQLQGIL